MEKKTIELTRSGKDPFYSDNTHPQKLLVSDCGDVKIWEEVFDDGTIHTFGGIKNIRYMLINDKWCQTTPQITEFLGKLYCMHTHATGPFDGVGLWFEALYSEWKQKFYGREFNKDEI